MGGGGARGGEVEFEATKTEPHGIHHSQIRRHRPQPVGVGFSRSLRILVSPLSLEPGASQSSAVRLGNDWESLPQGIIMKAGRRD